MSIKGTATEENLLKSFAGESQASNRYSYAAGVAKKEGYVQIADIFEETARQEQQHAKRFFKFLEGGELEVTACFPAGKLGTTAENLKAAAMGEHEEWSDLYPAFAAVAKKEGFPAIAAAWEKISIAEEQHEKRFNGLLSNVESGRVFQREEAVSWRCRNCGFVHTGTSAPELCAACVHPQAHFELLGENW
jgi:rubrerythrin